MIWKRALRAVIPVAYFLLRTSPFWRTGLEAADLSRLHHFWVDGASVGAALLDPRASGTAAALEQIICYSVAGLEAWPFRAMCRLLLATNAILLYRIAEHFTGSREAAIFGFLMATSPVGLADFFSKNESLGLLLGFTAVGSGLLLYIRQRRAGQRVQGTHVAAIAVLSALAATGGAIGRGRLSPLQPPSFARQMARAARAGDSPGCGGRNAGWWRSAGDWPCSFGWIRAVGDCGRVAGQPASADSVWLWLGVVIGFTAFAAAWRLRSRCGGPSSC